MASYADYYGIKLPTEAQVESGVNFGWAGTEFTGSLTGGGGSGDATAANQVLILAEIAKIIKSGEAVTKSRTGKTSIVETVTRN